MHFVAVAFVTPCNVEQDTNSAEYIISVFLFKGLLDKQMLNLWSVLVSKISFQVVGLPVKDC